jgi:hypothetical protein
MILLGAKNCLPVISAIPQGVIYYSGKKKMITVPGSKQLTNLAENALGGGPI